MEPRQNGMEREAAHSSGYCRWRINRLARCPRPAAWPWVFPRAAIIPRMNAPRPYSPSMARPAGKGTISRIVAQRLGWHYPTRPCTGGRDRRGLGRPRPGRPAPGALHLRHHDRLPRGRGGPRVLVNDVMPPTSRHRNRRGGGGDAAAIPEVGRPRDRQRVFRPAPGLVADGRDMGTVIFPMPPGVFDRERRRACRKRYKQLKDKGALLQ